MIKSVIARLTLAVGAVLALSSLPAVAQEKSELATILETKSVKVGAVMAPPWYNKDLTTNQWTGLVPDIMQAIFSKHGVKVEYVETQWGTAVAGLQSNRFSLLGAYNETPERAKVIDFTKPIGALRMAVLTFEPDVAKYATWDGINVPTVRLSAIDGSGATRLLQPQLPKTSWVVTSTSDAMFLELESRRANALLTSDIQISQFIQQRQKGQMVVPTPVQSQPTNIALRKNDAALRDWLNKQVDAMAADGSLNKIWAKYVVKAASK